MASKGLTPTPTTTHFPQPNDMPSMTPHSLTQVCFPKNKENLLITSTSTNKKLFSSTSALLEPASSITEPEKKNNLSSINLAEMWREVQGCNYWDNLVDPLHPLLRQEIVRYGELVVACYKAFDLDPNSRRYLCCKYGKRSMFQQIGMESSGYEVTKYIYATTDITIPILSRNTPSCSRWIGYVAVSGDDMTRKIGRRDILITFRGTVTNHEWMANFMSSLTPARLDPHNSHPGVKVESGFLSLYTSEDGSVNKFGLGSCREQLLSEVARLVNRYKGEEVSISLAGHSMGSSLAQLLAYDIAELGLNGEIMVTVFSFGGPRVGNLGFKERCEELGVKVLRIVNVHDPITKFPGFFLNENLGVLGGRYEFPWISCSCYAHVGVELVLDFFNVQNPSCVHDLDSYMINLLKCKRSSTSSSSSSSSSSSLVNLENDEIHFLNRAKKLVLRTQDFSMMPFKNVINLIQSQRADQFFMIDENMLGLINALALYIFLSVNNTWA